MFWPIVIVVAVAVVGANFYWWLLFGPTRRM